MQCPAGFGGTCSASILRPDWLPQLKGESGGPPLQPRIARI